MYYIIFNSRTHTISFFRVLVNCGIKANIINAPEGIKSVCNICISFLPQDFEDIKKLLFSRNYLSFMGVYKYDNMDRRRSLKKIF
ncbi:MAG TPA: DUF3343 domain-containing protein [Clostridia bacterium]|jgi:hypothetical protein